MDSSSSQTAQRAGRVVLPVEIILSIFEEIHQQDDLQSLSNCCRVSQLFNSLAQPILYQRIKILIKSGRGYGIDPVFSQSLLYHDHTGLKHVKHLIVSGDFIPNPASPDWPKEMQRHILFRILQNIPPNTLKSFMWFIKMAMPKYLLELLFEKQRSLEGLWIKSKDRYLDCESDLAKIDMRNRKLEHIHMIDHAPFDWEWFLYRMIQGSFNSIETLSLQPGVGSFGKWHSETYRRAQRLEHPRSAMDTFEGFSSWASILRTYMALGVSPDTQVELVPDSDVEPFPSLWYLALRFLDQSFVEVFPCIWDIFDISKLRVLKLQDCDEILIASCLNGKQLNLKTLHISSSAEECQIITILMSFSGLEELLLDFQCEGIDQMTSAVCYHKDSLKYLYWYPDSHRPISHDIDRRRRTSVLEECENLKEVAIPLHTSFAGYKDLQIERLWFLGVLPEGDQQRLISDIFSACPRLKNILIGREHGAYTYDMPDSEEFSHIYSVCRTDQYVSKTSLQEAPSHWPEFKFLDLEKPWMPSNLG